MNRSFIILSRQPFRALRTLLPSYHRIAAACLWVDWLLGASWEHAPTQGYLVFQRRVLAERTGLTQSQIRTLMTRLEEIGEIHVDADHQGTGLTVCHYATYVATSDFIALRRQRFYQFRRQFSLKHRAAATALWIELLLRANYISTSLDGRPMQPGDLVLGRDELSEQLGISVQKIRTLLAKLEASKEITRETTNRGTHVSINSYWSYVVNNLPDRPSNRQPATKKKPTNNHSEQGNKTTSTTNGEDLFLKGYRNNRKRPHDIRKNN